MITSGVAFLTTIIPSRFKLYFVLVVSLGALLLTNSYWQPKGYLEKPDMFYTGIYNGTTDTGESAPIWSVRFMERRASSSAEIIEGTGFIQQQSRSTTTHIYKTTSDERIKIRENTLYFPGWRVYIDGELNSDIQFQDPANRGLMTFFVPEGKHIVEIKFTDTRLRTISNYISLAALILIIGLILKTYKFTHNK